MTTTTTAAPPQHMEAWAKANRIRLERAEHKRWISQGRLSVVDVLDPECPLPDCLRTMSVGQLLAAQLHWGSARTRKLLVPHSIHENRRLCDLTKRQRAMLVPALERAWSDSEKKREYNRRHLSSSS